MANIILTNICNRNCPYCFARSEMEIRDADSSSDKFFMPMKNFLLILDFLETNHFPELRLLGGEPTLHPDFAEIVSIAVSRGLKIQLFTNAVIPKAAFDAVCRYHDHIGVLANINHPSTYSTKEWDKVCRTLKCLGNQLEISFNIYHPEFDLTFISDLIDNFSLMRKVRLGIAAPIIGGKNRFVRYQDYSIIGDRLISQMSLLESRDIAFHFDCGFTCCMFNEKHGPVLFNSLIDVISKCNHPIDIGTDLSVWPCFPLSQFKMGKITRDTKMSDIEKAIHSILEPFRILGMKDECADCKFKKRQQCMGGCIAHCIRAFQENGDTEVVEKLKYQFSLVSFS